MSVLMASTASLMKSLPGPASLVEVGVFTSSAGFIETVFGFILFSTFPPAVALAPGSIGHKLPCCLSAFLLVQALASQFDKSTFAGWFPSLQASPACVELGDEGGPDPLIRVHLSQPVWLLLLGLAF